MSDVRVRKYAYYVDFVAESVEAKAVFFRLFSDEIYSAITRRADAAKEIIEALKAEGLTVEE